MTTATIAEKAAAVLAEGSAHDRARHRREQENPVTLPATRQQARLISSLEPSQRVAAFTMNEHDLQQAVQELCDRLGITWCHPASLRGVPRGWPDMVIITPRRVIWRELKAQWGNCTPEQREFGRQLRRAGQSWQIWRPADLLAGAIERELADLAAIQAELFAAGETR